VFDEWIGLIREESVYSVWLGFALMIVIAFIPFMPVSVIAGAIGAVFNFWQALLINWGGATIGAILMVWLGRFLFQKPAFRYIHRYKQSAFILAFIEKHGLLSILTMRSLPVFPSFLVNLVASVARISFPTFIVATALGKLPTMITFTMAGRQLQYNVWVTLFLVLLYSTVVLLIAAKVRQRIYKKER
jgi:uncharacterized membrane protein YdjX (TVP38/TMEM64 family)